MDVSNLTIVEAWNELNKINNKNSQGNKTSK